MKWDLNKYSLDKIVKDYDRHGKTYRIDNGRISAKYYPMKRYSVGKKVTAAFFSALVIFFPVKVMAAENVIDVPQEVVEISENLGARYNICPELIQAICYKESGFCQNAVNGDCIGIMQVSAKWHEDRAKRLGVNDLNDISGNMAVGVDYLSELIGQYEDVGTCLMKYNGDSAYKESMRGSGALSDYAEDILEISAQLERKNGK